VIVVIESNFVLELALQQEEAGHAEAIVALADRQAIELVVPAWSLGEPHETLGRRIKDRKSTAGTLQEEAIQLERSRLSSGLAETAAFLSNALGQRGHDEALSLERTLTRLLTAATVLPLSKSVVEAAVRFRGEFKLSPQDALVFASVDEHLRRLAKGPKVFINMDTDFFKSEIRAHFQQLECKLLSRIATARQFLENEVRRRDH
jgi:predicted nucleic acid-binding protein